MIMPLDCYCVAVVTNSTADFSALTF